MTGSFNIFVWIKNLFYHYIETLMILYSYGIGKADLKPKKGKNKSKGGFEIDTYERVLKFPGVKLPTSHTAVIFFKQDGEKCICVTKMNQLLAEYVYPEDIFQLKDNERAYGFILEYVDCKGCKFNLKKHEPIDYKEQFAIFKRKENNGTLTDIAIGIEELRYDDIKYISPPGSTFNTPKHNNVFINDDHIESPDEFAYEEELNMSEVSEDEDTDVDSIPEYEQSFARNIFQRPSPQKNQQNKFQTGKNSQFNNNYNLRNKGENTQKTLYRSGGEGNRGGFSFPKQISYDSGANRQQKQPRTRMNRKKFN
jgi:hypothetical protein